MQEIRDTDEMREALQYLMRSEMPAQHKRVLLEALTDALRQQEAARTFAEAQHPAAEQWRPHETEAVESALRGKLARSWQHGDEVLMRLAAELHRRPDDIRAKAAELGLSSGVDYRLARSEGEKKD